MLHKKERLIMHPLTAPKLIITACCVALVCLCACTKRYSTQESQSLQPFHEFKLNNGIEVFVRQNPLSRMHSIILSINGGAGAVAPQKAGLDKIALQLMCMASERYPDSARRDILKRTSSAITTNTDLDYATIQMQTIDTHFTQTFDLFLNLIMQPTFPPKLFRETVTNAINAYRSNLTDGYARASRVANQAFFAGHPYQAYIDTPATLAGLSLQDIQNFYRSTLVAQRLTVFAAGNFNLDALKERLNATIGSLPMGSAAPAVSRRFPQSDRTRLILDSNAQLSPDASYLRGDFAIAPPDKADYWPLELAGKLLTDIMNDILRTRQGLVYSTWAAMFSKKANYGTLSAYRTSDPQKAIKLIAAAIDVVAQGKCVSPYSQKEIPGTYLEIEQALGYYKTAFSTEYYAGIQDNAAVAQRMAAAHNSYGDCRQFLYSVDRVNQVSARDIVRVVKRYMKKGRIIWALSAHPDTLAALKKSNSPDVPAYESVTLQ
jgi:predicted Zn-dependent peptidase